MMKKYHRICSTAAVFILILSLFTACGKPQDGNAASSEQQKGPAASGKASENTGPENIRFTALMTDPNARVTWGKDPISKKILEKTGVQLDFEVLTGDIDQKMGIMLASGDYPELLLSITNDSVAKFIESGALVPLDEYINKFGVNIKQVFGKDLVRMRHEADGRIYGLNREYNGKPAWTAGLFHVQYRMLMDAGYPMLKTLDDLYGLMKSYKQKHPDFNGKQIIGLTARAASFGMNITFNNPALRAGGQQNDGNYLVTDNLEVKYGLTTDIAREYLKWLNKLNREGLLDPEAVIQERDMFVSKISSGRVLAVTTESWDLGDSQASLRKQGLDDRCYASFPLLLSEDIPSDISNYDSTGSWKSVITNKCKDPERAFKFFDTMWSEEMQVLCNWGVEDQHYTVENGKRVLKQELLDISNNDPEWRNKTGISIYNMWSAGENVPGRDGQYINPYGSPELSIKAQDNVTKEVLSRYNVKMWNDLCPPGKPSPWGFVWKLTLPQDSEGAVAETRVNDDVRRKAIPKIVMAGTDEEFDREWDNFVAASREAGIDIREKEISEMLKKRMEMWQ